MLYVYTHFSLFAYIKASKTPQLSNITQHEVVASKVSSVFVIKFLPLKCMEIHMYFICHILCWFPVCTALACV